MRNLFYCLLVILCHTITFGQQLLPPIFNYTTYEYKAGSKNWDITIAKDGELYIANNRGLLFFNGESWQLYKLPNNTIIRSIAKIGNRIYTGSYEEFGYWVKNNIGQLQYKSLTHLIRNHTFTSEEFWEIIPINDKQIAFRSFSTIYIYEPEQQKIQVITPTQVISDFIVFKEQLIVATGTGTLYLLSGDKLTTLPYSSVLKNNAITDMAIWNNKLFIGTKLNGCFTIENGKALAWKTALNTELKAHQLNKLKVLDNGDIAFGTIKNGLYLYQAKTGSTAIYNKATGLQNNTVLSMHPFKNQLWIGLDNGLARLNLNPATTYFTDTTGSLGMVYDIAKHDNIQYLGSNTGVFKVENEGLTFIEGSQGHVWNLSVIEGDLLCGHNTGTYKITDSNFELISPHSGGYTFVKQPNRPKTYLQGTYTGLVWFEKKGMDWEIHKLEGYTTPVKQICFETDHILWTAHPYKGYHRVHLNPKNKRIVDSIQSFDSKENPSGYNVKIFNIKNQITINTDGKWYRFNPINNQIENFAEFEPYENKELLYYDHSSYWFVNNETHRILKTNLASDSLLIDELPIRQRLSSDSQNLIPYSNNTYAIPLNDGFALIEESKLLAQQGKAVVQKPKLISLNTSTTSYNPLANKVNLPFAPSRELELKLAAPAEIDCSYTYQIEGSTSFNGFSETGFISLSNLPYGSYTCKVFTMGMGNKQSEPVQFSFSIKPPWYLSWYSLIGYLLLLVLTVFIIRLYNRRKLYKRKTELELQMQQEQKEQLAKIEREELAKQVKIKQNELTNTTLNIAKKNEIMLEMKNLLLMNKEKFSNSKRYQSYIKKLDQSIEDADDWNKFEFHFNELHDDFFEKLLKEYPSLTPKDLRLCAYLKMNLTSKEIAPLMGISVRGVEIHRYRLRKKLNLDSSENLSNFLITI
ncbi:LuxR C-terminal-related transcriptional regulator [Croceivirga radicis]|uniref:LuxR C-terminal-related transcriptional regulator n=1 Tax=Croceivirga radicis TaxID=1929488 RepID=UPI0009DAF7DE|nr:LuxR C-terminal-related transcriptional regulator [Croceivirga radicis]